MLETSRIPPFTKERSSFVHTKPKVSCCLKGGKVGGMRMCQKPPSIGTAVNRSITSTCFGSKASLHILANAQICHRFQPAVFDNYRYPRYLLQKMKTITRAMIAINNTKATLFTTLLRNKFAEIRPPVIVVFTGSTNIINYVFL